jgi:hypothetical protein
LRVLLSVFEQLSGEEITRNLCVTIPSAAIMNPKFYHHTCPILLIAFIIIAEVASDELNKTAPCFDNKCVCSAERGLLICEDFDSFAELNFSASNFAINSLFLKPRRKIALNSGLNLTGLQFNKTYALISLNNLNSIKYTARAFQHLSTSQSLKLIIDQSDLVFDYDIGLMNSSSLSPFSSFTDIVFHSKNLYARAQLSPRWFTSTRQNLTVVFYNLSSRGNIFTVNNNTGLRIGAAAWASSITSLCFIECDLDRLDASVLDPVLFENIKNLNITTSFLNSVDGNLLGELKFLRSVELKLINFEEFDVSWTGYLKNVSVKASRATSNQLNESSHLYFPSFVDHQLKSELSVVSSENNETPQQSCSALLDEQDKSRMQQIVALLAIGIGFGVLCLALLVSNIVIFVKYRALRRLRSEVSYEVDYFQSSFMPREGE